ncbi:hypothetical protein [Streptomyces sp. NPDC008001]|uniref:hypothetical protein n=1 Tax=Streptomyces sp. NPDC008001 TaxID=3364804 RepID=UPI0036E894F8
MTTELRGLPREIVAGSGWHAFAYRAANTSDRVIASLSASVELRSWDRKNLQDETTKHITVQWYDSRTRRWEPLPADHGYFARTTGLGPRASADASLRLRIDAAAPAGSGVAFQTGFFSDQDRTCGYAAGAHYSFAVLTAGSRLSTDEDARATAAGPEKAAAPTTTVNRPAPQGIPADAPATGKLASTGASSSSPLLLGVAGATIAVGAVAVAVARRGRDR